MSLKTKSFCNSREVLAAKRKNLVKQGRGNKPNACRKLTSEEKEKLFESGAFGCHNPEALQRTLWWFFSLNFGFRARDESWKLCSGDLELQIDPETGRESLVWRSSFASTTIGSISNCAFTVHPRYPAGSTDENVAKRPRLDGSS